MVFDAQNHKKQMFTNLQASTSAPLRLFVIDGRNHRYALNLNEYYEDWKNLTDKVTASLLKIEQERGITILNRGKQTFDPNNKANQYLQDIVFIEKQSDKQKYVAQQEFKQKNGEYAVVRTNDEAYFNPNYYLGDSVYFSVYNNSIEPKEFYELFEHHFLSLGLDSKYKFHMGTGVYQTDNILESIDKVFRLDADQFIEQTFKLQADAVLFDKEQASQASPYALYMIKPTKTLPNLEHLIDAITAHIVSLEQKQDSPILNRDKGIIYIANQSQKQQILNNVDKLFEKSMPRASYDKLVTQKLTKEQTDYSTSIVTDELYGPLFRANQIDSTINNSKQAMLNPALDLSSQIASFSVHKEMLTSAQFLNIVNQSAQELGIEADFKFGSAQYSTENPAQIANKLFRNKAKEHVAPTLQ